MAESVWVALGVCGAETGGELAASRPGADGAPLQLLSYLDVEAVVPLDLTLAHVEALC